MFKCLIGLAIGLAFATCVKAHETWLLPRRARLDAPGAVMLAISSGMAFPKPDTPPSPKRLDRSGVRIGSNVAPLEAVNVVGGATFVRAPLPTMGLAAIWLDLPAVPLVLDDALIDVYFDEIRADPALREAWARDQPRPWRERFAKFATTFVRVGPSDPADRSWAEPLGGALEIVPESDPTTLGNDPSVSVRVLKEGRALNGQMVAAQSGGGTREWQRTDEAGRVTFQLRGNGPWLISATELKRVDRADVDWESWFATLTIPRQQ